MTAIKDMDPLAFRTLAIDYDGVIHAYSKGWHDGTCYDGPMSGALEAIDRWRAVRPVAVMSCRPVGSIYEWFYQHAPHIPCLPDEEMLRDHWATLNTVLITNRKIVAQHYIDDRAIRHLSWTCTNLDIDAHDHTYAVAAWVRRGGSNAER